MAPAGLLLNITIQSTYHAGGSIVQPVPWDTADGRLEVACPAGKHEGSMGNPRDPRATGKGQSLWISCGWPDGTERTLAEGRARACAPSHESSDARDWGLLKIRPIMFEPVAPASLLWAAAHPPAVTGRRQASVT